MDTELQVVDMAVKLQVLGTKALNVFFFVLSLVYITFDYLFCLSTFPKREYVLPLYTL